MILNSRKQALTSLRGQRVCISDLDTVFHNWPQDVNPMLEFLRHEVEDRLESILPSDKRLGKLKAADFGLFGASWWPRANFSHCRIITFLAIWLFVWDDEIDSEIGPLAGDLEGARNFREETVCFIRNTLGLSNQENYETPHNPIINSFATIGVELCRTYSIEQRHTLLTEIEFFMQTSEAEQHMRLQGSLPSLEEYTGCRMGTSAVGVCLALNEYACSTELPSSLICDVDMRELWDQTNVIVWIVNDLLSVKKELAQDTVDSLIPLLYATNGNAQKSIETAQITLRSTVRNFEETAKRLAKKFDHDPLIRDHLRSFIEACKYNCTGNLSWSLRTGRYGLGIKSLGDIQIIL